MDNTLDNKKLIPEIILMGILMVILHKMALSLYLYWSVSWSDIVMHFLGGVFGGLAAIFVILRFIKEDFSKNKMILLYVSVSAVLVFGTIWELWEVYIGFSDITTDLGDTILDLNMDTFGSIAACAYSVNKLWKKEN